MCPDRGAAASVTPRRGFALPFAIFALLTVMMLVAVVLDAAVAELRTARGGLAAARASGAVQSALASVIDAPSDSSWLSSSIGTTRTTTTAAGGDSVTLTLQRLGARCSRVVVRAVSQAGGSRGAAGAVAFLDLIPDSAVASGVRFSRLPGWWWVAVP